MINVGVRKHDAANRSAQGSRRFAYPGRCSGKAGVNQSESIVFLDQKAVDDAQATHTKQVLGFLS